MPTVRESARRPPSPWESLALRQPPSTQEMLDTAALATMPVPVVGDVAGLASDAYRFATDPESRTLGNAAWASLGMLPFVPHAGVTKKVAEALDMSQEARMARAAEQGFDTAQPVFHGTNRNFRGFSLKKAGERSNTLGEGVYVSTNPELSSHFADGEGGNVIKAFARTERPFDATYDGAMGLLDRYPELVNEMRKAAGQPEMPADVLQRHAQIQRDRLSEAFAKSDRQGRVALQDFLEDQQALIRQGHDAVRWGDEMAVFDPSQIRSVHAAFDPAKRNSGDLLASLAGAGLLGTTAARLYGDDEQ